MPSITKYVKRFESNTGITYSFKMDDYVRNKLMSAPNGSYVHVGPNKFEEGTYSMSYSLPKATAEAVSIDF